MVVHAHPDDESISTGGTLARYAVEGVRTTVVSATRGEAGEILDKALDPREARPRLAAIREAELREACRILQVRELIFLGYEDSGMYGRRRNRARQAFWRADYHQAVGRLIQAIRRVKPQVIVADNEIGGYGHPDHIQAHRIAVGAFFMASDTELFPQDEPWRPLKLYYTAWPASRVKQMNAAMRRAGMEEFSSDGEDWSFATPDDRVTTQLDVEGYLEVKMAAMRAHRTQIPEDSWFMKMARLMGPRLWGVEHYERVRSLVPAADPEDDLFAGIR